VGDIVVVVAVGAGTGAGGRTAPDCWWASSVSVVAAAASSGLGWCVGTCLAALKGVPEGNWRLLLGCCERTVENRSARTRCGAVDERAACMGSGETQGRGSCGSSRGRRTGAAWLRWARWPFRNPRERRTGWERSGSRSNEGTVEGGCVGSCRFSTK
jgi:hypothetical protein